MSYRPDPLTSHEFSESEFIKITAIVHAVFYAGRDIKFAVVRKTITFNSTFLALDDGLRPITVFQGFWYPGMIIAPYVTIQAPVVDRTKWQQCVQQLRLSGMEEFAFKIYHEHNYAIDPPTHTWYNGAIRSFRSYTLLKAITECRLMDVKMDLESVTEAEKQANSVRWNFSTLAKHALEHALVTLEDQSSAGQLEP